MGRATLSLFYIYGRQSLCWLCDGVRGCPRAVDSHEDGCTQRRRDDGEMGKRLQRSWDGFGVIAEVRCGHRWGPHWRFFCIMSVSFSCINRNMFVFYSVQITRKFLGLIAFKHSSLTLDLNISLLYLVI